MARRTRPNEHPSGKACFSQQGVGRFTINTMPAPTPSQGCTQAPTGPHPQPSEKASSAPAHGLTKDPTAWRVVTTIGSSALPRSWGGKGSVWRRGTTPGKLKPSWASIADPCVDMEWGDKVASLHTRAAMQQSRTFPPGANAHMPQRGMDPMLTCPIGSWTPGIAALARYAGNVCATTSSCVVPLGQRVARCKGNAGEVAEMTGGDGPHDSDEVAPCRSRKLSVQRAPR